MFCDDKKQVKKVNENIRLELTSSHGCGYDNIKDHVEEWVGKDAHLLLEWPLLLLTRHGTGCDPE